MPNEVQFLAELARRVPPTLGYVISTKRGKINVTAEEWRHLESLSIQTGRPFDQLIGTFM